MSNDDYSDYIYFWEVDSIYDIDGDLLIWSLMSVATCSYLEAVFVAVDFPKVLSEQIQNHMES